MKKVKEEKGQALVEFAFILPIMMVFIFAIMDIGWITAQRGMFLQGCEHMTWGITAAKLGDTDSLDSTPSLKTYNTGNIAPLIYSDLYNRSLLGFDPNNLTIVSAIAELYNVEESFDVPGRDPSITVSAISRTRYMDLTIDMTYDIYPITFVGQTLFGEKLTLKKTLTCTRIIGTQHRSE